MKLSVVITSHNNQDLITDCLKSVRFADEIIIIDNQSTDDTAKIAKKHGAKVIKHKNEPTNLNKSKNFGFTKAKHQWILSLDSDERVEPDLKQQILKAVRQKNNSVIGYYIPRKNIIFGKWIQHGLWYPDHQLRLFQKSKGKFPASHNHELLQVTGQTQYLTGHILHLNYTSVSQYIQKIDRQYSDNEVEVFLKKGNHIHWYDALRFPLQDFLTNYFAREAYKDGLHGLVLSILQAFYMFVVFCKIWEKQEFQPQAVKLTAVDSELKRFRSQVKYWLLHCRAQSASLPRRLLLKIQSKL